MEYRYIIGKVNYTVQLNLNNETNLKFKKCRTGTYDIDCISLNFSVLSTGVFKKKEEEKTSNQK